MSPHLEHSAPIPTQSKYLINMCVGSHPARPTVLLTCMIKLHSVRTGQRKHHSCSFPSRTRPESISTRWTQERESKVCGGPNQSHFQLDLGKFSLIIFNYYSITVVSIFHLLPSFIHPSPSSHSQFP